MAELPSVLFMSCTDTHPNDIIKLFLNVENLPDKVHIEDDIYAIPWKIDNKYYTAEVNLCSFPNRTVGSEKFANSVNAIVLYFDSHAKGFLEKVESWLTLIEKYTPEVKILVTKNIRDNGMQCEGSTKKTVLEWCVGKGFELVELEPIIEEENSKEEEDFPEVTGIKRVIQALNAHVWPNLILKNQTHQTNIPTNLQNHQTGFNNLREKLGLEESLDELVDDEDEFSQLFSQLSEMKERISSMSETSRKEAAEEVVKAFWRAMGGDDNEFTDK